MSMVWVSGILNGMKINAEEIIEKLSKSEPIRKPISIFLDRPLYERFKTACGKVSASRVIEELMRQFLDSRKKKG